MYTVITILIIITCVLLALVIMVQNAKGGGLAAGFASSGQIMGVQKTSDFIEKLTWGLALSLVVLCLAASFALPSREQQQKIGSSMQEQIDNPTNTPQKAPVSPPPQNQQQGQPANPQGK